jgi:hypothetical protein
MVRAFYHHQRTVGWKNPRWPGYRDFSPG